MPYCTDDEIHWEMQKQSSLFTSENLEPGGSEGSLLRPMLRRSEQGGRHNRMGSCAPRDRVRKCVGHRMSNDWAPKLRGIRSQAQKGGIKAKDRAEV